MANKARVRVEVRGHYNSDRESDFKIMLSKFRRACADAGVQSAVRKHEAYESPSRKRRRKQRASEVARQKALKNRLRENFPKRSK